MEKYLIAILYKQEIMTGIFEVPEDYSFSLDSNGFSRLKEIMYQQVEKKHKIYNALKSCNRRCVSVISFSKLSSY